MTTCSSEFVIKNCECLPDPMDPSDHVCGYVNIQNGLVYPCDPGCCKGKCNKALTGVRFKIEPTQYSDILPPGFNINFPQPEAPSPPVAVAHADLPIWKLIIALLVGFSLMVVLVT